MSRCWGCVQENCQDCNCECHKDNERYVPEKDDGVRKQRDRFAKRIAELEKKLEKYEPKPKEKGAHEKLYEEYMAKVKEMKLRCKHPKRFVESTNKSSTGNLDADRYWTICECKQCGSVWEKPQ